MLLRFTTHAIDRMRERGIEEQLIRSVIHSPDSVQVSIRVDSRFIAKKFYRLKTGQKRLLMIIYDRREDELLIVTVIDTSKIDKYS